MSSADASPADVGSAGGGLQLFGVHGLGEVTAGDDLASLLADALVAAGRSLEPGDILVVSSKIVSKADGQVVAADSRDAQITAETVRVVAARRTPNGISRIVEAAAGPVMAAAGVDASNVAPGTVLLLPKDPDASARGLRAALQERTGIAIGVIVSDTAGRAWRDGQVDFALGAAGVQVTDDLRGAVDTHGQSLEVTVRALVDELAAAADLVKGKLTGIPAAVIRGLPGLTTIEDGPGAAALLRPARTDWFRHGHVEAVRASLGVVEGRVEPPRIPEDDVPTRLSRALDVAQHSQEPLPLDGGSAFSSVMVLRSDHPEQHEHPARTELRLVTSGPATPEDWLYLGELAARIRAAAWSEDLAVEVTASTVPSPTLTVVATALW